MISVSTSSLGSRFKRASEQVELARSLGFSSIEIGLNEIPPQYDDLPASLEKFGVEVVSVLAGAQEPAGTEYRSAEKLAAKDEKIRQDALASIVQDIKLAARARASTLIIPGGFVGVPGMTARINSLLSHLRQGREKAAQDLKEELRLALDPLRLEHLDRLCRSIFAIARKEPGLQIAVSTPKDPHFLPTPTEMEYILEDLSQLKVFYYHDCGNAAFLEKLVGIPQGVWLEKLVHATVGVRFNDLSGWERRQPPGLGEIDWKLVSDYASKSAFHVLDVDSQLGNEALRQAVRFLETFGF